MYIYHSTGLPYFFTVLKICITLSLHCIYNINTISIHIPSGSTFQLHLYNLHKKYQKNCASIQIQKSLVCLQFVNKLFISRS